MAAQAIRPRDLSELQVDPRSFDFTGMTAAALADFQPYLDANEQDEAAAAQIVGTGPQHDADLDTLLQAASAAADITQSQDVVQSQTDLHNAADGEQAMQNDLAAIDVTGVGYVEHLTPPVKVPKQWWDVPTGDVLITTRALFFQLFQFWPADKPIPKGWVLVTQDEITASGAPAQNGSANTTQAGG